MLHSAQESELPWFQEPVRAPELSNARSYGEEVKATLGNLFVFDNAVESLHILNTLGPALKKVPAVFSALQSVLANIDLSAEDKSENKAAVEKCKEILTKLGFWTAHSKAKKKNLNQSIQQLKSALKAVNDAIPTTHRKESTVTKNTLGKINEIITILHILHQNVTVIVTNFSQHKNIQFTTAVITVCGKLCNQTEQLTLLSSVLTTMSPTLLWSRRVTLVGTALPSLMDAVGDRYLLIQKTKELIQLAQSGGLWPPEGLRSWRLDLYRTLLALINDPLIFKMFFNVMYNISIQLKGEVAKKTGSAVSVTLDTVGALRYLQYIPYFSYMSYFSLFSNPQTSLINAAFTVVDAIAPESSASLIKIAQLFTHVATLNPLEAMSASRGLLGDALAQIAQNKTSEELLAIEPHLQAILPEILKGILFNEGEVSQFTNNDPSFSIDRTSGFISKEKIDVGSQYGLDFLKTKEIAYDGLQMGISAALSFFEPAAANNGQSKTANKSKEKKATPPTPPKQDKPAELKLDPELEPLWNPDVDQEGNVTAKLFYKLFALLGKQVNYEYIHCKKINSPGYVSSAVYGTVSTIGQRFSAGLSTAGTLFQQVTSTPQVNSPAPSEAKTIPAPPANYSEQKKQAEDAKAAIDVKKDNILLAITKLECNTPPELQAKYNEIYAEIVALDSEITETEKKFELCYEARILFNSTELNYKKDCIQALLKSLAIKARDLMLSRITSDTPILRERLKPKPASEQINDPDIDLFHKQAEQFIQFMGPKNRQPLEDFTESFYSDEIEAQAQVTLNTKKNDFLDSVLDQAIFTLESKPNLEKFEFNLDKKDDYFIHVLQRKCLAFKEKIATLNNVADKKQILQQKLDAFEKKAADEIKKQYQRYISDELDKISTQLTQEAIQCLSGPEENKNAPNNRLEQLYSRVNSNNHKNYAIGDFFPSYKLIPNAPELKSNAELKVSEQSLPQSSGGFLDYVSSAATAAMGTISSAVIAAGTTIATTATSVGAHIVGSISLEDQYAAEIKGHEESVRRFNEKLSNISTIIHEAKNNPQYSESAVKKLKTLSGQAALEEKKQDIRVPADATKQAVPVEKERKDEGGIVAERMRGRDAPEEEQQHPELNLSVVVIRKEEQYEMPREIADDAQRREEHRIIAGQQRPLEYGMPAIVVGSQQGLQEQYGVPAAVEQEDPQRLSEQHESPVEIERRDQRPPGQHNEISEAGLFPAIVAEIDEQRSRVVIEAPERKEEQHDEEVAAEDQQRLQEHNNEVHLAVIIVVPNEAPVVAVAEDAPVRVPEQVSTPAAEEKHQGLSLSNAQRREEPDEVLGEDAQRREGPPEQHEAPAVAEVNRVQGEAGVEQHNKVLVVVEDPQRPREEEAKRAEAQIISRTPKDLLAELEFFVKKLPDNNSDKMNGNTVHELGLKESDRVLNSPEEKVLADSLKLVIAIISKPSNNKQEKEALATFVRGQATEGNPSLSNQFLYALGCLAVGAAAIIGLGLAGVPFASAAGWYIGGSVLMAGGAALFCCRRESKQKGLSEAYTNSLNVLAPSV